MLEEKIEETPVENPLFEASEATEPIDGEPAEEVALFDDPVAEEANTPIPRAAFLKRVGKLTGQRNELKAQLDGISARLHETNGKLAEASRVAKVVQDKYARFPNMDPAVAFSADVTYLEAFEALSHTNPEVAKAVDVVRRHIDNGGKPAMTTTPSAPAPAPTTDPAVTKLLQANARSTVDAILVANGVRESFRGLIANDVLSKVAAVDLPDLDKAAVLQHAKTFILANKLTSAEVLAPKTPAAPAPKARKPVSVAPLGGAPAPGAPGAPVAAPAPPKTRDEWAANRDARLAAIVNSAAAEE